MAARVNRGRQKISLQKIENDSSRSVTFSKRKSGILNKSSELCTLTGAKVVVLIRSEKNKTFSFGHPSVQVIVSHFLLVNPEHQANTYITRQFLESFSTMELEGLNAEYNVMADEFLRCKQLKEVLARTEKVCEEGHRYKRSLSDMDNELLESFERDLLKMDDIVSQRFEELRQRQAQVMHQDVTIGSGSGFMDFNPLTGALPVPFHKGSSLSHNAMRSGSTPSSSFWQAI